MDVSIGLVFRDFKNDANPGVNGADEGGMILCAYNHICPAVHQLAGLLSQDRRDTGVFPSKAYLGFPREFFV